MSLRSSLLLAALFVIFSFVPTTRAASLACDILNSPVALKPGLVSPNVYFLQKLLNLDPATRVAVSGPGSPGKEINRYGPATAAAVSRFQMKYASSILTPSGLTKGTGSVGAATRKKLWALYCSTGSVKSTLPTTPTPSTAPKITLVANPSSVISGGTSIISWSSTNATSCNTPWGNTATSGTYTTPGITNPTSYNVTCTGPGGSRIATVSIAVNTDPAPKPSDPPTVTLTANPDTVTSGASSMLTWSSTNATSCSGSGAWSGVKFTQGSQNLPGLTTTGTYTLTCTGSGGTASSNVTVTVINDIPQPPPDGGAPTVTIAASPTTVSSGGSSTLTWSSTNATSCTASGGWSGSKATSGTQQITNITNTSTYTLTCTGANGSANNSATVTVSGGAAPTVTITANPSSVNSGGSSTLTWSSTNATSCNASGGWTGTQATSGTQTINNITNTAIYTLTCTGSGGSGSGSTMVTVNAQGGGTNIVQFTLLSGTSGVKPFTTGHAFRIGDVPAGHYVTSDYGTLQVIPKNYWPDGSLKFAILSGTANLTANQWKAITLSQGTTPPSGTALTTANLKATGITASIGAGSYGTVNWATTDWDNPFVTWVSGPRMSSWIYRKPVGTDPSLVAWLEVRLYEDGSVEVLPWIENGYLLVPGPTNKKATYTFTLGGTQRFNQAINLAHHQRTPLVSGTALSYWLSGTTPDVTPHLDTTYLQNTEVVPSYRGSIPTTHAFFTAPSPPSGVGIVTSFTPLQNGDLWYQNDDMSQSGFQWPIGLLPTHDVLYLIGQPGTEKMTYKALVWNGYSAGRYATHYRDETTNMVVRPSQYPNLVLSDHSSFKDNGSSTKGQLTPTPDTSGAVPAYYDHAHHPEMGYMAYLVTGQYYFMEETQFLATTNYLGIGDNLRGAGLSLFYPTAGAVQTRAAAWDMRSLALAASAAPDGSAYSTERLLAVKNNINYYYNTYLGQPNNPQGSIDATCGAYNSPNGTCVGAPWQQDFSIGAWGYLQALNLAGLSSSDRTKLSQFFNWHAGFVVGRLGTFADWPYNNADTYNFAFGPNLSADWQGGTGPWFPDFATAYQGTQPLNNAELSIWGAKSDDHLLHSEYAVDSGRSFWGNLQPAIAYAVRFNVPGALTSYFRMTGANGTATDPQTNQSWSGSDYQNLLAQFNNGAAVWGVRPVVDPVNNSPTLSISASPTTVSSGGSSTLTWSSTNATSCTASGAWNGSKATSGTQQITGITNTGTYTLTCTGSGGSNSNSVVITVTAPAPTVSIGASPSSVTSGGSSTLTWSSTNATSCTASGAWNGSKATSGTQQITGITNTGTYTLTCTGTGGTGSGNATVTVVASGMPAWRTGAQVNQWVTVTSTSMRAAGLTTNLAYSGMAYDPTTHTIYSAASGGHTDSPDNSVSSINVFTDAPAWTQLRAISVSYQPDVSHYSDGRPSSRHVYAAESFYNGKIYQVGARFVYGSGVTFTDVDAFNLTTGDWLPAGTLPNLPAGYGTGALLDRTRGVVYTSDLGRYRLSDGFADHPISDTTGGLQIRFPLAMDTTSDRIFNLQFGDGQGYGTPGLSASVVPLSGTGANTRVAVSWDSGSSAALADFNSWAPTYAGMDYDSRNNKFYFVSPETLGKGKIFVITPTSTNTNWNMSELTVTPITVGLDGIYSRWVYDATLGGFLLLPGVYDSLLFLPTI